MIAAERETVITITDDKDEMVDIWTCRRKDITALSKKVQPVASGTYPDGTAWARFEIPSQRYDVSRGIRTTRNLSEAQREALRNRLASARNGQGSD